MDHQKENLLDIFELLGYLKKKIAILLATTAVFALGAYIVSTFFIAPVYKASTRVYVLNRVNEESLISSDFSISNYLIKDYAVLITGRNVTQKVIDKLGLNMSNSALASKISISAPENTRVLQISITDTDPQQAADIANCVRDEAVTQLQQIMDVDAVNVVYNAEVPTAPFSPNIGRNTVVWGALGLAGAIVVLTLIFVLDDAIRTEDDVERYLGIGTLGIIPLSEELNLDRKNTNRLHAGFGLGRGLKWKK